MRVAAECRRVWQESRDLDLQRGLGVLSSVLLAGLEQKTEMKHLNHSRPLCHPLEVSAIATLLSMPTALPGRQQVFARATVF